MHQAGAARGSPPRSLLHRFHPASPCNVSEKSISARLLCCSFTIRTARACCARGGGAGTQLLATFRTVHLRTHIHEHTACPVYVLILCVHGNFSCCTGFVCIMGLLGRTHSLPSLCSRSFRLALQGRCPFASPLLMLCTNNCHKCWKSKHNSLLPISLCAR